jgi:hypothetical protein
MSQSVVPRSEFLNINFNTPDDDENENEAMEVNDDEITNDEENDISNIINSGTNNNIIYQKTRKLMKNVMSV